MEPNRSIGKGARVLLVEDEPAIGEIVTEALEEQGFEVLFADNAPDALFLLTAAGRIDVLFTDVNLPGDIDGTALAQLARAMRPDLPIVYTSGRRPGAYSLRPDKRSVFVAKAYDPFAVGPMLDSLMGMWAA